MFVMLDIDFFKQYNDLYGHLQGDKCLKVIASILQDESDKINADAVRYGGEEFLIVKMSDEKFDVQAFIKSVNEEIKNSLLHRADMPPYYVTVSMGVWCHHLTHVMSIENAIKYADESLYQAKANGRNCAVFADDCLIYHDENESLG